MAAIDPGATPEGGNSASTQPDWNSLDNPYLKRFQDTQASFTQGQQELARLKRYEEDPNAYYELGAKHGVEFEFPGQQQAQQQGQEDPYAARLEAAEARLAAHDARIAAENAAAGEELFHADLDSWAEADGVKLSKADHNAIFGLLMKAPDPTQEATARQIFDAHVADRKAEREAWQQEYEEQRKRPRVPTPPVGGAAHTGAPNWREMSESDQNEYMAQRAAGQI